MDAHIILSDIRRAKKLAKTARRTDPSLTHAQHLDEIARREYGLRHYHELDALHKKTMSQYLVPAGGAVRCRFCGLQFDSDYAPDIKTHEQTHEAYEQAQAYFGFLPSQYDEREKRKKQGYSGLDSPDLATRREAALSVVFAYFERSLDSAIRSGFWQEHPSFNDYIREIAPVANFLPMELRRWLTEEYGPPKTHVDLSDTYWSSSSRRLAAQ